jgi:glycosyltransferase involved in cell wall biosynthesis
VSARGNTRVAFGAPVFNRAAYLEEALESLLAQTFRDFALVVVDDCSTDATPDVVRHFAAEDARVHYERNPTRVGMVENWRRAYRAAVEHTPGVEYFAFASDHDVWDPLWLERMVRELDADPAVVVAFPLWVPIDEEGQRIHANPRRRWETAGLTDPGQRLSRVAPGRRAPNVVYGLFRAAALERCGVYTPVLLPDRFLMAQLAVLGTFKQVPEELWMRRLWRDQWQRPHQRTRLFAGRIPFHAYLPSGLVHAAMFFRWVVLEGQARPEVGRARGLRLFWIYARRALLYPTLRQKTSARKWLRRRHKSLERSGVPAAIRRWTRARQKTARRLGRRTRRTGSAAVLVAARRLRLPRRG